MKHLSLLTLPNCEAGALRLRPLWGTRPIDDEYFNNTASTKESPMERNRIEACGWSTL